MCIRDSLETGVDCGGPNCPPCNGTVVETNLGGYYFETGWDGWTKGGSYASRYSGSLSPEGQFSIRISFNQQVSSSFSSPNLNLATLDSVKIQFLFFTQSVETGERFELQYFNGSLWITLASYTVSYTHLDVYKRQPFSRARAPCRRWRSRSAPPAAPPPAP